MRAQKRRDEAAGVGLNKKKIIPPTVAKVSEEKQVAPAKSARAIQPLPTTHTPTSITVKQAIPAAAAAPLKPKPYLQLDGASRRRDDPYVVSTNTLLIFL